MPVIDLVQWPEQEARGVYAWKFKETNLSTYAQLLVRESQEAVLFSKGKLIGKFGPGKHTLSTENLPILRTMFGLPFGGTKNNPFTAEVWFVNKTVPSNIDWATDAMMYHDPDYQTMVPLSAKGRYGLRVDDAERFLVELVGSASRYDAKDLTDHFHGEVVTKTKTAILQYMLAQRIGIKTVNACLSVLSEALQAAMSPFWERFGFALAGFYVTSVEVDNQTEAGKRILDAMSRQSAQVIGGYTYQQGRALDIADCAAQAGSGGLLQLLMLTGMPSSGGLMQPAATLPGTHTSRASGTLPETAATFPVYCSSCGKKYTSDMKFCPHCGDQYVPCPNCLADTGAGTQRCVSCGALLKALAAAATVCSRCHSTLSGNQPFCPNCGQKVRS